MKTRFFDRLSRNDKMRKAPRTTPEKDAARARHVYRDIYYI